jgi:hypothetical protein
MPQTQDRSLQQIKREAEQTRANLTDTVAQLRTTLTETASDIRERIRPEAIKAEVSGYIKTRGEQLLNDVTDAARKNPMQAVAVGAAVTYPLLRLVRSIPVPVLMVGAGLFLAGSKTGQSATRKAGEIASDLSDEVGRRASDLRSQVGESISAAKTHAADQLDRVTAGLSGGADQVNRAADTAGAALASNAQNIQEKAASLGASVSDRASDLTDEGLRMASSAAVAAQDIAAGATATARNAAGTGAEAGLDAARRMRDRASHLTERTGKTILQTIEQNPLAVAGVGLLIGGLIASALPRSEFEDDLVGDASTAVKRRAQTAVSQGVDAAKNAAGEIYDETVRQAEAESLTPEGIGKAAQDLGQRVRRVAASAVTTAFESAQDENEPQDENQRRFTE